MFSGHDEAEELYEKEMKTRKKKKKYKLAMKIVKKVGKAFIIEIYPGYPKETDRLLTIEERCLVCRALKFYAEKGDF